VSVSRAFVVVGLCVISIVLGACEGAFAGPRVIVGVDASHKVITEPFHEVIPSTNADDATIAVTVSTPQFGQFGIEGGFRMIRATRPDGTIVLDRRVGDGAVALPSGKYELGTYVLNCDGNCDLLDGPSNLCSVEATVEASERYELTITIQPRAAMTCAVAALN
jgi:hypothetical protein